MSRGQNPNPFLTRTSISDIEEEPPLTPNYSFIAEVILLAEAECPTLEIEVRIGDLEPGSVEIRKRILQAVC